MLSPTLYIVATPIGHMDDLSPRAVATLQDVAVIAAEDTRVAGRLLHHHQVRTPLLSLHDHNESARVPAIVSRLRAGESVALISDAGTPLISDPGYRLVRGVRGAGFAVVPVPGACAAIAALSVAGLPTDRFVFEGFLPAKSSARLQRLMALSNESRTMVFYESPHRILACLQDCATVFGADRALAFCRELTKRFETTALLTMGEAIAWVGDDPNQQRGELVLVVAGRADAQTADTLEAARILRLLLPQMTVKTAAAIAADILQQPRKPLYALAVQLSQSSDELP